MSVLISDISLGLTEELPHLNRTMNMKRIIKWLRRDTPPQSIASEADQRDVGIKPEQKTEDEYSDVSSYNWEAIDRNESSDSGKDTPKPEQIDSMVTAPLTTLKLEDDPMSVTEEDTGVDPYNTGRFDTKNK